MIILFLQLSDASISSLARSCILSVSNPSHDVYIVIKLEKVSSVKSSDSFGYSKEKLVSSTALNTKIKQY